MATELIARRVPLEQIAPDPDQPRKDITPEDLSELVLSIRAHGVLQPISLSRHPDSGLHQETPYMIVTGERRWAAASLAGLNEIPATISQGDLSPSDRLMVQLEENDHANRRELSLFDRVNALSRALHLSGLGPQAFCDRHGKSHGWLAHYLRLARADEVTRAALSERHLRGITTANLFLRLPKEDKRELLERARRTRRPITDRLIEAAAQKRLEQELPAPDANPPQDASRDSTPDPSDATTESSPWSTAASATALPREPITIPLSLRQLEHLIILLGQEPLETAEQQVHQLYSFLS